MIMGSDNVHQHQTGKNKLLSPTKPEKNKLLSINNHKGANTFLVLYLEGASTFLGALLWK